jgi:hypothetical protein
VLNACIRIAVEMCPASSHLRVVGYEHAAGRDVPDQVTLPRRVNLDETAATDASNASPRCPNCGTTMLISHIVPERQGYETRTFECPQCEHSEGQGDVSAPDFTGVLGETLAVAGPSGHADVPRRNPEAAYGNPSLTGRKGWGPGKCPSIRECVMKAPQPV